CNQTLLSDMISSKSLSSLLTTLLYILGFTAIIELIGAAAILADIHGTMNMTLNEEITFSLFHSISAFCNAGFSTLPSNLGNEMLMSGHNPFYITISILVILGSIGFPILVNLNDWIKYIFRRAKKQFQQHSFRVDRQIHIYDINTKIVVLVTFLLLGVGTLSIGALEWNGAFADMPIIDRCVQSFFTAVCPRTAGFSSVNIDSFGIQSIMIILFLMVIGGAAQSTAGGIKMNTFAVILLNIKAILRGNDKVIVFNRVLSHDSIRRSNSTLVLYILFVFIALFLLTIFEPEESLLALLFETISALSTVGSSLDLTMELGNNSKYVIIALMFIGRVGVLTIMASIIKEKSTSRVEFTSGNIIIN
ncbi:MAG: potassium transporter TrkG, partial [Rikenellaceae bacterium]